MKFKMSLLFFLCLLILTACGNRKSPTGGPVDNDKPTILNVTPNNYEEIENNQISITFSKPIDQTSILSGIYFYPPILNKTYKWNNNTVTIKINEKLNKDTNYYMTLLNTIKCYHGNNFEAPTTFIFKNGSLNNYKLSGLIQYENIADVNETKKILVLDNDSLLVLEKSITDSNWIIENMNNQNYIIRSYIDKNKNNRYDFGIEPFSEFVTKNNTIFPLQMKLTYADTTKPVIKTINAISKNEILLTFSKNLITKPYVLLINEKEKKMLQINHSELNDNLFYLITDVQDTTKYAVKIRNMIDNKNNFSEEINTYMMGTDKEDTIIPKIINCSVRNGATISESIPEIEILFSEIMLKDQVSFNLYENETHNQIPMKAINFNSSKWKFKPEIELKPFNSYTFTISKNSTDHNKNKLENDFIIQFLIKDKKK